MSLQTEADEIERAASGDRLAQSALAARHLPRVYALARRMTGDDHLAEDIAQEAFLRAWKALPDWEPKAKLSTWLHRVTVNLCYDRARKKREALPGELPEQTDPSPGPGEALHAAETGRAIDAAIGRLPERQRAAALLCLVEGESNISAAESLEISVEALESLLARARRTLRAELAAVKETWT